jgi:Homeodomain-like domain
VGEASRAKKWQGAERKAEVARLTAKGWSCRRISGELGCSHATVARDQNEVLAELAEHRVKDAERIRANELEKLDRAEAACVAILERAEDADAELALKAADRIARLQERRAKLLGLDAPEKVEAVVTEGPTPEVAARLVREAFAVRETNEGADARADSGAAEAADDSDRGPVG